MFTFGREHEINCALETLPKKDSEKERLIVAVINSIHDLIEQTTSEETVKKSITSAFIEGGTGVWEKTGGWLRKLIKHYPGFEPMWEEFAAHTNWKIRFRAACFLDEMPTPIARKLCLQLKSDSNKKVREMAAAREAELK